MDQPIIDRKRLASFSAGDTALERELLALYLETAALYVDRMRRAGNDVAAWRSGAHALKGASANIGAVAVARLAARYEQEPPNLSALGLLEREIGEVQRVAGTLSPSATG
jgi:HPt (histidine-containing phosphotransfer) domain-containing protein